jgi:hypothetical protein
MKTALDSQSSKFQVPIFIIGMILFIAIACFGWVKLQYGFNFIDEGYHATESWRLAVGDHFLKDKLTGALALYTLITQIIFRIYPDISLLQLRQIQFILTIVSLLLFSFALFRQSRQYYAWLPFVFSLFAFTGLDPTGMISNLYYQTYPHLFIVLFLSFMLFGFQAKGITIKKSLFLLSGFCLWLMNLSMLHLGVMILSPIIIFIFSHKFKLNDYPLTFNDLLYILSPFVISWILFIAVFNKAFVSNILFTLDLALSMSDSSGGLFNIDWEVIKHITISIVFLSLFFVAIKKLAVQLSLIGCAVLSLIILLIIDTSLFGFLIPYWKGRFAEPMWFSSLLMSFTILFWMHTIRKFFLKDIFSKEEALGIILMVPFTICSLTMSLFSTLGALSVTQSSIPAVAAIACMLTSHFKPIKYQQPVAIVALMLLLGPFYYTTARHDWDFTFFDLPPKQETVRIEAGFGRGIYTNPIYLRIYDWLATNAAAFTQPDDYAISYVISPMVHMITKLRPSLDETFISFTRPGSYYEKCIEKMKQRGRDPKIAFIFERQLILLPVSLERGTVTSPRKEFDFIKSQDPISIYVRTHMTPASTFRISKDNIIRCYVNQDLKHAQQGQP